MVLTGTKHYSQSMAEPNKQHGFTLVELMITLAIAGVVMGGVFQAFLSQQDSYLVQEEVTVMQQNVRAAMNQMAREIRMATYAPVTGNGGIDMTNSNTTKFTFTNETDTIGTLQTIEYRLYDAYGDNGGVSDDLGRAVGGSGNIRALAENIDRLEFIYLDANGATTAIASDISSIQVSLLARSDREDKKMSNTAHTYTTIAGTNWACNDGTLVPFWDCNKNFRHRLLSTTIHLRN